MGHSPVLNLQCPNCQHYWNHLSVELEEAYAVIAGLKRLLAKEAFFEVGANGLVTSFNRKACDATGISDAEAVGQPLKELVMEKHKARVTQAMSSRPALRKPGVSSGGSEAPLSAVAFNSRKKGDGSGAADVSFNLVPFQGNDHKFFGLAGFSVQHELKAQQARSQLPQSMAGVTAWRSTMHTDMSMPPSFEWSQAKQGSESDVDRAARSEGFREIVQGTVEETVECLEDGSDVFESEIVPYEFEDGTTYYYIVRGSCSRARMPNGSYVIVAEGFAFDITSMRVMLLDSETWHDRWRLLVQNFCDVVLCLDIQERRCTQAWHDLEFFGESLEGKRMADVMNGEQMNVAVKAFNLALLNGSHTQELSFWSRQQQKALVAECCMCSEPSDASVIFMGLSFSRAKQQSALAYTCEDNSGSVATAASSSVAAAADKKKDADAAAANAPRLTAAYLHFNSKQPLGPPGLWGGGGGGGNRPQNCSLRGYQGPPAQGSVKRRNSRGGLGEKAPPVYVGRPKAAAQSTGSRRSISTCGVPRVFPTQVLLLDEEGRELWRSKEEMIDEELQAADLLDSKGKNRLGMPKEFADTISAQTHALSFFDDACQDYLQVANLSRTSLQSLQRPSGASNTLMLSIAPLEEFEEAFETIPARAM
eukprot:TRINITY_DN8052_c0_g2_i1.p1 TRINITY_DN8052_c0_g2~~TRINITY_DN8052_c0_g2_i1.p1  ORF type:complete len:648 (-),score=155.61 TRINITY_DN8052_c0_g2_i1:280-2223(-)